MFLCIFSWVVVAVAIIAAVVGWHGFLWFLLGIVLVEVVALLVIFIAYSRRICG
jgi:hypothetical protein